MPPIPVFLLHPVYIYICISLQQFNMWLCFVLDFITEGKSERNSDGGDEDQAVQRGDAGPQFHAALHRLHDNGWHPGPGLQFSQEPGFERQGYIQNQAWGVGGSQGFSEGNKTLLNQNFKISANFSVTTKEKRK